MAQIKSNWTAPTFSFDAADQPTAWEDFYIRALDYLETLRIKPDVEDQEVKGIRVGLNLCSKTVSWADVLFAYSCTATNLS